VASRHTVRPASRPARGRHADSPAAAASAAHAARPSAEAELFPVWSDNEGAVVMFMRLQTQWRANNGTVLGLNYQSAEFLIKIHGVADAAAMMDDLQAMEVAALQVMNERKE
jgi:hypothetical protein